MKIIILILFLFSIHGHSLVSAVSFESDKLDRAVIIVREIAVATNYSYDSTGNRTRKTTRYAPITITPSLTTGQFLGAIEFPSAELAPARVLVSIGKKGAFTASFEIGGRRVPWKSVFTANGSGGGTWAGTVNDPILGLLNVRLEVPSDGGQMTVFLTQNEQTSTALLALAGQRGGGRVSAGLHTILLPANPDFPEDGFPQGDGYASLRITAKGGVTLAGRLGDGTTITQGGPLTSDGRFQVFIPIYKKAGVLTGWVDFVPQTGISDFNGVLHWSKPENDRDALYPQGFDLALDLMGSRYNSPLRGRRILNFNASDGQSLLGFSKGNLSEVVLKEAVLGADNKLTFPNPGTESPKFSITVSNGLFSGSFLHPEIGKRVPFAGVVFQRQNIASGHFKGVNQTGLVSLQRNLFSGLVLPEASVAMPDNEILNPPMGSKMEWSEEFNDSVLDAAKWGAENSPVVSVSNGSVSVTNGAIWSGWISTKDKVAFQGRKFIIEFRAKRNSQYDLFLALVDSANATNSLHVMESSHWSNTGLSLMTEGAFGVSSQSSGSATTGWKEYRLTIDSNTAVVGRGDDLSNITETFTKVMNDSVHHFSFYINIGAAGGNTSQIDWIRVSVE